MNIARKTSHIAELERKLYATQHQVDSLRKQRETLTAQNDIKDAQLKAADMYISYLVNVAGDGKEFVIPFVELAKFKMGYEVACNYDEKTKDITINVVRQE